MLHTRTWGTAGLSRKAVLLHGITSSAGSWVAVGPMLADSGYRCTAPDMLGHGRSPKPPGGYDWASITRWTADSVPNEPDLIVGHSIGGLLAMQAVAQGLLSPGHLVLEDPALHMSSKERAQRLLHEVAQLPVDADALRRENSGWSVDDARERAEALAMLDWDAVRQAFVGNAPWDSRPLLDAVAARTRVLYVLPPVSDWVSSDDAYRAADVIGPGGLVTVSGSGHSIHRDRLTEFMRVVLTWIDSDRDKKLIARRREPAL